MATQTQSVIQTRSICLVLYVELHSVFLFDADSDIVRYIAGFAIGIAIYDGSWLHDVSETLICQLREALDHIWKLLRSPLVLNFCASANL